MMHSQKSHGRILQRERTHPVVLTELKQQQDQKPGFLTNRLIP